MRSYTPVELQHREEEQQQLLISSQIQHHLNQISMHMSMDDEAVYDVPSNDGAIDMQHQLPMVDGLFDSHHAAGSFPSSSSSSSLSLSLRSASLSCSPESSSRILAAAPAAGYQYPEVSSHVLPLAHELPNDDHHYHGQYANNLHVPTPAARHEAVAMAPELPANTGAFKRYARHLGPRRPPKPGACGQRMFKTAISVLSKMHMAARHKQQYYYQASAEAAAPPASVNQLQHMISERKRREKLNHSFHALKAVLPLGAKKDKTSILIRAREYLRSLESKLSELEEKNKSLESRLTQRDSGDDGRKDAGDNDFGEKVRIEITREAEEWAIEPRDLCTLKIVVRSRCSMTDVVLRTLQCLKDQVGDGVSMVAMSTSCSTGPPQTNTFPRTVLTLQIKSPGAEWDEQPVKDAVAKVVADALTLPSSETAAAPQRQ
ncbi:putative transcription factor bHLH041 isoform X2 [Phragmites australis]|uniref:putative transcription factor bHLH041 isoform X2 n=1 Tax=Phragmites australis TaxID=29695 RepID=UPI002D7A0E6C|nr:putative transcription factor bHLH041 isoform X2 [Phragmites australis]